MDDRMVVLTRAGACLVLDLDTPWLPRVLHWGADLGPGVDAAALRAVAVPAGVAGRRPTRRRRRCCPRRPTAGPGGWASRARATVPTRTCGWRRSASPSPLTAAASR